MSDRPTPFLKDLGWRLEAGAFAAYVALFRLLPVDRASDLGAWLFRRVGPLTGTQRTVRRNLQIAFPELSEAERERLAADQWAQTGRTFAEFGLMDRIVGDPSRVEVVGRERLQAIADERRPTVFFSGHLANWEVMAAVIVNAGVTCQVTYRAANNPYVDRLFKKSRAAYGVQLFAPKGGDGSRELLASLARGESVALMNDQKFNGGVEAPFFGVLCRTAPGPTRLAIRAGRVLQPMSVLRLRKARFRVTVHDPIPIPDTGDRTADIRAGVEAVNAFMEDRVRAAPEQWFWTHKRWPNAVYEPAPESVARLNGPA